MKKLNNKWLLQEWTNVWFVDSKLRLLYWEIKTISNWFAICKMINQEIWKNKNSFEINVELGKLKILRRNYE